MSDLKLKDIEGLNGNTVNALEVGGVSTMADYMGRDNAELLSIKGVGAKALANLATTLQPEIQRFRQEPPVEEVKDEVNPILDTTTPYEHPDEAIPLPSPEPMPEIDVDSIPDPEPTPQQRLEDIPAKTDEVLVELAEEQVVEEALDDEVDIYLVDVNPTQFADWRVATSFLLDWLIASRPFVAVPKTGESLQKAFVSKWKEHVVKQ